MINGSNEENAYLATLLARFGKFQAAWHEQQHDPNMEDWIKDLMQGHERLPETEDVGINGNVDSEEHDAKPAVYSDTGNIIKYGKGVEEHCRKISLEVIERTRADRQHRFSAYRTPDHSGKDGAVIELVWKDGIGIELSITFLDVYPPLDMTTWDVNCHGRDNHFSIEAPCIDSVDALLMGNLIISYVAENAK